MEVIDAKSVQPASSGHDSWPEAPDLQLDCFSSDEEEAIDESEPESTSSDDSSVKEITKSVLDPEIKETIANNSLDCKPGTSRTNIIPDISPAINNVGPVPGTSTASAVTAPLVKCPEAITDPPPTLVVKSSSVGEPSSRLAITSKLASRNGHLLIDLTNSDDESNNRNRIEQRRNSNAESAARRVHHARRSGRNLMQSSNARMSCIQEAPANLTQRHHPASGFVANGAQGSSAHPFAPCRYLPQHQVLQNPGAQPALQTSHTSSIPQPGLPEIISNGSNNNTNPCSYSNCFVASSSNGNIAAPSAGPCPHNHGYCPMPNPQHFLLPTNRPQQAPQFVLPPTPLIPPAPNGHHHPMFHYYTAQQQQPIPPPAAHSRIPMPPFTSAPTNMSTAHLQTWLSQHRRAEMERQRYMQHELR